MIDEPNFLMMIFVNNDRKLLRDSVSEAGRRYAMFPLLPNSPDPDIISDPDI